MIVASVAQLCGNDLKGQLAPVAVIADVSQEYM
jgi:hypothetical protein